MELELARRNMVQSQIQAGAVRDARVLGAFADVPREAFVPAAHRARAFAELEIPLACGQRMMTPRTEALTLEAVALQPGERALEIGTGSGFLAACMARLGAQVDSVEYHAELADTARAVLARCGCDAVRVQQADVWDWEPAERYDAIVATASMPYYDDRFESWVHPGGRLFAVVGQAPAMDAGVVHVLQPGRAWRESMFESQLQPLIRDWFPPRGFGQ